MITIVSLCNVLSQLVLKKGVISLGIDRVDISYLPKVFMSPIVLTALAIQIFSYIVWLFVLAKANLGFAAGLSGALFYIILALLGWILFNERMTPLQWIGLALISSGVFFMVTKAF